MTLMHHPSETVALTRDVIAALVPSGQKVELPEGASATITQALGGSFTVVVQGHMFRIEGQDADALGKDPPQTPQVPEDASREDLEKAVWSQLRTCYDPEIPIDVVELGLVYECALAPTPEGGHKVSIKMTLTAPGCGMGEYLVGDVRDKVRQVPGIADAEVELVFDPPWNRDMMSENAKLALGML
jgi:probable FeS assembly SUF system protein SufT